MMRSMVVGLALAAGLAGVTVVHGTAEARRGATLTGTWQLDTRLSDAPRGFMGSRHDAGRGPDGGGWDRGGQPGDGAWHGAPNGAGRGSGGDERGGDNSGGWDRAGNGPRHGFGGGRLPDLLRIEQGRNDLRIEDGSGTLVRELVFSGPARSGHDVARWRGDHLEMNRTLPNGATIVERMSLDRRGRQLEVLTSVSGPRGARQFRRVYDRVG
jgi:hypothetical protein